QNGNNTLIAFRYLMKSEVVPFPWTRPDEYYFTNDIAPDPAMRKARCEEVKRLAPNMNELRLKFSWPLLPNGATGPGAQVFRTTLGGRQADPSPRVGNFLFQPQSFTNPPSS